MTLSFRCLGGSFGSFFAASWGPSGGLLEASLEGPWGPFGGSGGRLEVKHHFGGLDFFREGRLALFPDFWALKNILFYSVFGSWRPFRLHIYSESVKSTKKSSSKRWL